MKKTLIFLMVITIFCFTGCSSWSDSDSKAAALAAADAWLSLIDFENYAESWDNSARFFQAAVSKEKWMQTMQGARKPLGKNLSRKLKSKEYHTSMPGVPDGRYVVIKFVASFENKKNAIETVTPMLDTDGRWRVSGYYMK
ncbi:MAG: DUF4019 domain-containing protein [Deltaproteobacteria bacterium]|nr:DUF4019 domain-containing protein [Deltaproteobacteria bacterium]